MSRKIILSILVIVVAIGLVGAGTFTLWSDTAISAGNEFKTGNLSLTIDSPVGRGISVENMYPGATAVYPFLIRNDGSIPGRLSMTGAFVNVGGGTLASVLSVRSVKVNGVEKLGAPAPLSGFNGVDYLDLTTGLAPGQPAAVEITIGMASSATGNMNESVSGDVTFKLDQ